MRFTEHELTLAVTAAARTVATARGRRRTSADDAWKALSRIDRYHLLEAAGSQVLPVLLALPDVEVEPGTRPSFTDAQVLAAVEQTMDGAGGGRLRRKVSAAARATLVKVALAALPPRQDPDALVVPDSL